MSNRTIVICGKGGVGKTTVSAIIARHLAQWKGHRTLIVDADHAGGLSIALGIEPVHTLQDLRHQALEELKSQSASRKEDLLQFVEYHLLAALTERDRLAFLALGRPDENGCFCSVNTVLKRGLEILRAQFDTTIIDAEAGVEQINRDVAGDIDFLLLVADTSVKALRVAETIQQVTRRMNRATQYGLLVNRVRDSAELDLIRARTSLPILGWISEDLLIQEYDATARSFFELPDCLATKTVTEVLAEIIVDQRPPVQ